MTHRWVWIAALALASPAVAQQVIYSDPTDPALSFGKGSGSRNVVRVGGQYFVFFATSNGVQYVSSPDGLTFSAPLPASTTPADLGFSVDTYGNRIGLTWGHADGGYSHWYREAAVSDGGLSFLTPTAIAQSTNLRGYQPSIVFSRSGEIFLNAYEYGHAYDAGVVTGCGSTSRYRMGPYTSTDGVNWFFFGYCNNYDTVQDPSSLALAALDDGRVTAAAFDHQNAYVSTAIYAGGSELGEPWTLVNGVEQITSGELTAVGSATDAGEVFYVYPNSSGSLVFALQDATNAAQNSGPILTGTISDAGVNPVLSRPSAASGCYTVGWIEGSQILRTTFSGDPPVFGSPAAFASPSTAPVELSAELEAPVAPAFTWRVGSALYFQIAAGGPAPQLFPPASAPADGQTITAVSSSAFVDSCGTPVAAGTLVTVGSTLGSIADADLDPATPGVQVAVGAGGTVVFNVQSPAQAGTASLSAIPAAGGPAATGSMTFVSAPFDSGIADAGVGDSGVSDSGSADAGEIDSGSPDSGPPDAGGADSGTTDSGTTDSGTTDAGPIDSGLPDAGSTDAGRLDAGAASVSLQVTVSPDRNVAPGEAVTFTALVGNEGSSAAHLFLSLSTSDIVIDGATRDGASLSTIPNGFDLGAVTPGVTTTVTLTADVAGQSTSTASATFQLEDAEQHPVSGAVTVQAGVARVSTSLGCGCGASDGAPALWILGAIAALGARVRRRRPA